MKTLALTTFLPLTTLLLLAAALPARAAIPAPTPTPAGLQFTLDTSTLSIQFFSDDTARITFAPTPLPTLHSFSVIATPAKTNFTQSESAQAYLLTGPHFKIAIDKQSAAVSFLDLHDKLLLRESPAGRQIIPATQPGISGNAAAQTFDLPPDEAIYGLGQHQQGAWNYRGAPDADGANLQLAQANTNVAIPVITSSKGYMLLWDNPAVTNVSVNSAANAGKNLIRWSSESAKAIDYYFCFNDGSPASALKAYRRLTGEAPLMPKWLLGFWQCKERYASQDELLSVAKRFRDMHVPIDGIIQDWQYWPPGNNTWGSHQFDPARYPDPVAMFKTLHDEHLHALISVWAKFDVGSANSKELNDNGGMFPEITRYVSPPGEGQWYDPFADKGRELYWKQINRELFAKGVDGWWLDAPEPEINAMAFRTYDTPLGHGYQVYNAYPLMHSTGIYQGQRAATDDKRVVILTRSAYAGQQRNSAITWSGDIRGNWQVFKNQIPAGLNFSLSGIPYWNTDTGGFFGDRSAGNGDPANPAYQELFSRWFQFSAFCPMFRVHGSYGLKPGKEIWRFDDNTQALMRKYLDLRYRLLPYLYSVAWDITHNGQTFMRPLAFDFPSDPAALDIGNEYLFGPAILVTPVTTRGAAKQSVYLPNTPGPWTNFWTGAPAPSGQSIDTDAPIDTLPLYIRPGSILPLGPLLQYSSEKPADPIELRIYPGADGSFTLYEDQGDSYRYEKGAYATIPFTWNDATKTLTIGNRTGQFPGMLQSRTFNVTLVHQNHGHALAESLPDQHLTYTGAQLTVNLTPH